MSIVGSSALHAYLFRIPFLNANDTGFCDFKKLLEQALGLDPKNSSDRSDDFREFLGVWSDEERLAFDKAIGDCARTDEEDWK